MNGRDHDAETAAAQHVVAVVGGQYALHDTGTEPGQYDVDIKTKNGVTVALEVTSFGGENWRRTAARVTKTRKRGTFAGEGLERHWWVVFPTGADLRAMDQPLTEVLRRLEQEGRDRATRRYEGEDPFLHEVAQILGELNVSAVEVWDVGLGEDAPRILLSQSDTWVGGGWRSSRGFDRPIREA